MTPPDLVELRVPCSKRVLSMLRRGLPTSFVRVEERGDGRHDLIVHGPRGPLHDPFRDVELVDDIKEQRDRFAGALEVIARNDTGTWRQIATDALHPGGNGSG